MIQQNASASEEMASMAEELSGQAEQLTKTMAFFKLTKESAVNAKHEARPANVARQTNPATAITVVTPPQRAGR